MVRLPHYEVAWQDGRMTNRPDADLPSLLMQAGREMRRLKVTALEPYGITPHQSRALGTVSRLEGECEVRPSVIAERLGIAPRSATEVLDALEGAGLLRRAPSPTDRRATVVELTEQGRAVRARIEADRASQVGSYVGSLSDADQEQLRTLLVRLLGASPDDTP